MRKLALFLLVVLAASCGGAPTAPTPKTPSVVGTYSGTATFTFPELQQSLTCPASTTTTQSGTTVSIAPMILSGDCGTLSIPFGQVSIDGTGAIGGNSSGTFNQPSCGNYNFAASGGFFGRELRLSMSATSATCYNFNFTAVLSR